MSENEKDESDRAIIDTVFPEKQKRIIRPRVLKSEYDQMRASYSMLLWKISILGAIGWILFIIDMVFFK